MIENTKIDASNKEELEVLQTVLSLLQKLDSDSRKKIINTITTFFDMGLSTQNNLYLGSTDTPPRSSSFMPTFSDDRSMTPKQFMLEKQPHTDVERVACLAYYLTHYLETPYFKTLDISKLNTDAAQRKFSNAAKAVDNATSYGYLTHAPSKGKKQLSASGELFVQALPNRAEAKQAISMARPKRKPRTKSKRE